MNTQIKKLSEELINQIAAGEVVERPASVVKELIENSLDANADSLTIELANGGKTLVKLIDNGAGLSNDQFPLVFERHATSKIGSLSDLEQNSLLGFRGEALATIASVSIIEFASNGFFVDGTGQSGHKAMPNGTQVTVKNLFHNTPARLKFLKTDQTEYLQCLRLVEQYALAHPDKNFKLIHNSRQVLNLNACTLEQRIVQILGDTVATKMLPVFYQGTDMTVSGFIGKPELAKDKMSHQYVFVAGRPLYAPFIYHAVKAGFGSTIFPSEKPMLLININLNPKDIDMNVHPRKTEAKFHFQSIVYSNVIRAVKKALESNILTPKISLRPQGVDSFVDTTPSRFSFGTQERRPSAYSQTDFSSKVSLPESMETKLKPVHQIANSYILCESENGLVIIDQHAAHERVMYEKLKQAASNKSAIKQNLLVPQTVELSESEFQTVIKAKPILDSIGFEIEEFGAKTIVIRSIPDKFSKNDLENLLKGLIEDLHDEVDFSSLKTAEDTVLHYAACRGAIKFGQLLSHFEQVALIKEMEAISGREYSCPHGRPTMIELSFDDLEKQFKRK